MLRWLIGIILGEIICKSSNWQYIQRLKITILGANWQFFRLERIAKCSYFILSTQNIKFYWFVMKRKKFLLLIWWYNRALLPLGNKYFVVFILNGLKMFVLGTRKVLYGVSALLVLSGTSFNSISTLVAFSRRCDDGEIISWHQVLSKCYIQYCSNAELSQIIIIIINDLAIFWSARVAKS